MTDPTTMSPTQRIVRRVLTFHLVCLGWVFFRATSMDNAFEVLAQLGSPGAAPLVTPVVLALIALGIGIQYLPRELGLRLEERFAEPRPVLVAGIGGLGLLVIDALGPQGIAPFIYFQF